MSLRFQPQEYSLVNIKQKPIFSATSLFKRSQLVLYYINAINLRINEQSIMSVSLYFSKLFYPKVFYFFLRIMIAWTSLYNIMLAQDTQLQDLIKQVESLSLNSRKDKVLVFLKQKIVSTHPEDAIIIQKIIQPANITANIVSYQDIAELITSNVKNVKSLSIFLVLYSVWDKCRRTAYFSLDWGTEYEHKRRQKLLENFNQWVMSTAALQPAMCNQVLSRVLTGLPSLLEGEKIRSTEVQFDSCLQWLSVFTIKSRDEHLCGLRATRLVKEVSDIRISDFQKKEHLILRRIIELLGNKQRRNGSLYLFFDKFTIRSQDIEYFINIKEDFFQDLDQNHLCNVFIALLHSGLNRQILQLFQKISALLKSHEQFFILRTLFEEIVLPIVTPRYKTHRKLGEQVFNFVLFYVAGFLYHCSIGEEGVLCILDNMENLKDPQLKRKWGQLALLSCKQQANLKAMTMNSLQKICLNVNSDSLINYIHKEQMIWTVTMHNGRKLKKYPEIQSYKFRGIQNMSNQCYIISVVQALFTTQQLRNLINNLKLEIKSKKLQVLKQLRFIFEDDLNIESKKNRPTVQYLKNLGPQQFKKTEQQQDAQEYLVKLFQHIENQLKQTKNGLNEFNDIFRAEFRNKIYCTTCKYERELKDVEYTYVNTYSTKENFELTREEPLDQNYKCEKCESKKSVKISRIVNKPKILILHINRFGQKQGQLKKLLGNHPIKRVIGDYRLVGFIAHKGTHIHAGHYLYYYRVDQGRWALFNDVRVTEFNVGDNEEFEREFRAENTPYILFYRLKELIQK